MVMLWYGSLVGQDLGQASGGISGFRYGLHEHTKAIFGEGRSVDAIADRDLS